MFYLSEIDGKKILKSDYIKGAEAFFTTRDICICDKRLAPISKEAMDVIELNKKVISQYLKILPENFLSPTQTHSTNIGVAKASQKEYPETDALILAEKDIAIYLNYADCTPIILYDEKLDIGAVSHAGWRGTAGKIASLTVQRMIKDFNATPKDIVAVIGPTIGFCCYDVGEEVLEKLSKSVSDFSGLFEIREGKIYVDLKNINKRQLEEVGIDRIDVCPYCTVHNNNLFYSYRRENGTTLRHSAILSL